MKRVLCLDLGVKLGWALLNADGSMGSGCLNLQPERTHRKGLKFLHLQKFLSALPKIDAVYFEQVFAHKGVHAAHAYGGYLAIVMAWCESKGIKCKGIGVQQIKFAVTNNYRAQKADVIEAVEKLGHMPMDDNEADAIAILHYVQKYCLPEKQGGADVH